MKKLQIFNYELNEIRTVTINGELWWIAKDVCSLFGDTNHNRSTGRVPEEDKTIVDLIDSMGRRQKATAVNESGLYALLFQMQPQKANNNGVSDAYLIEIEGRIEKLRKFKKWVTSEVLPKIRKTGKFETAYTNARGKSKKVRNAFTSTLQNHGCDKFYHYINITKSMKVNLSIDKSKKKDAYDIIELAKTTASESVATVNMLQYNADSYQECKVISDNASLMIEQATRKQIA